MSDKNAAALAHHEAIDVESPARPRPQEARLWTVRQERQATAVANCYIEIASERHTIQNYSDFGLAIITGTRFAPNSEFTGCTVACANFEVGKYDVRIVRVSTLESGRYECGLEVLGEPIETLFMQGLSHAIQLLQSRDARIDEGKKVPNNFRRLVLEMKDWLEHLEESCETLEATLDWEDPQISVLRDHIASAIGAKLASELPQTYEALRSSLTGLVPAETTAAMSYFRGKLSHLIYQSPLADRAFRKPLGYAGDFQMMKIVYEHQGAGKSLFGKCMHRYFVDVPASKAVRNRAEYLCEKLKALLPSRRNGHAVKILSVACGPAKEIELLLNSNVDLPAGGLEVHLLDQDVKALKEAQRGIMGAARKRRLTVKLVMHHLAIKNVIARGLREHSFDMIYSAGLFDYLSDPVARLAAQNLGACLRENGKLIIGNFKIGNPSQLMMEFVMDWPLIYRSEGDLHRLFGQVGSCEIETEKEGINLFCVISKRDQVE